MQGSIAAAPPPFLAGELTDGGEIHVLIENFGKMRDAMQQCRVFWNGKPSGRAR